MNSSRWRPQASFISRNTILSTPGNPHGSNARAQSSRKGSPVYALRSLKYSLSANASNGHLQTRSRSDLEIVLVPPPLRD